MRVVNVIDGHAPGEEHREFALAVHRELASEVNLAWSPYSVASALGLVAAGAGGVTGRELLRLLAPGGELTAHAGLLKRSAGPRDAEVAVATALWLRQGLPVDDSYREHALSWPGGAVHAADFEHDPEGTRRRVNADVEKTTRGLVRELVTAGLIDPDTAAVVVNALYLKVAWQHRFAESATRPADFHAPTGTRQVPMMHLHERLPYGEATGWRRVSLPTAGEVAVDILLPEPDGQTAALEPAVLLELDRASRPTTVDLALPRFEVETQVELNEPLQRLGVVTAFTDAADFSGITRSARVRVDHAVHKTLLRVDERGLEGAAATAVTMKLVSLDLSRPVLFHIDRPFVVVVRHVHTGAIYFVARVVDPAPSHPTTARP